MQEFEFAVPPHTDFAQVAMAIESTCAAAGLQIGMKGTLTTFPGSTHWHFKKPGQRGTLELTSFPRERRIWAKVQTGRRADWILPSLTKIRLELDRLLKNQTK
jgi:hypothetical protein